MQSQPELTPAQKREKLKVAEEKFKRMQRKFFEHFCKNPELFPDEPPAKHHQFMIGALQGVANGEIKRLMVLMPPGHGKSVYCSVRFPHGIWATTPGTIWFTPPTAVNWLGSTGARRAT